jgi:hypothetical protein
MHSLGELFVPKTPDSRSWDPQNREFNLNPPCSFFFFLHVDYLLQRFDVYQYLISVRNRIFYIEVSTPLSLNTSGRCRLLQLERGRLDLLVTSGAQVGVAPPPRVSATQPSISEFLILLWMVENVILTHFSN